MNFFRRLKIKLCLVAYMSHTRSGGYKGGSSAEPWLMGSFLSHPHSTGVVIMEPGTHRIFKSKRGPSPPNPAQCFLTMATHLITGGNLKTTADRVHTQRLQFNRLGHGLSISIFLICPGDPKEQPKWRTTALVQNTDLQTSSSFSLFTSKTTTASSYYCNINNSLNIRSF